MKLQFRSTTIRLTALFPPTCSTCSRKSLAQNVLSQAHRALQTNGLLCLVSITPGTTPISRFVMGTWQWIFSQKPSIVGGCRPSQLTELLPAAQWQIRFQTVVVAWGIASEVVIAAPIKV